MGYVVGAGPKVVGRWGQAGPLARGHNSRGGLWRAVGTTVGFSGGPGGRKGWIWGFRLGMETRFQ